MSILDLPSPQQKYSFISTYKYFKAHLTFSMLHVFVKHIAEEIKLYSYLPWIYFE